MNSPASQSFNRIGLIAGSGEYPIFLAKEALKQNVQVVAIGFTGITSSQITEILPDIHWIPFGQFEPLVRIFLESGIQNAIFAGKVPQTIIFKSNEFDQITQLTMNKLENHQADSLIGAAVEAFSRFGIKFLDARTFLESNLADPGIMTVRKPTEEEMSNINYGFRIAKHIALEDIGQTVVIKQKAILAVEAMEGTDQAILRAFEYGGGNLIVVKVSKPKQDFRFDVPIIGMDTLEVMIKAKVSILAVDAKKTIILDKPKVVKTANDFNLCIYGVSEH